MIKINGVLIKTPKSFKYSLSDIDGESNRNTNGDMIRDRIATKVKLELEWGPLTNSEIANILQAIKDIFFDVTYPDAFLGTETTKTMYVGDRNSPVYMIKNDIPLWEGLSCNFIEQ